ncbi:hypothetical protein L1987_49266 [Smallanthus sonchifolius]|uniref:Uncharacterized protein n=1 Tax=Smallanthus sonchifolius TaxID=185202 RepID=A0ACB9FV69_9ASTR|nr:hypothetical protein L1987_49266 [Smallanthus sonchifolius]
MPSCRGFWPTFDEELVYVVGSFLSANVAGGGVVLDSCSWGDEEKEAVVEGGEEIQGDALIPMEELRLVKREKER